MKPVHLLVLGSVLLLAAAATGAFLASGVQHTGLPLGIWVAYGVGAVLTILVGSGLFLLLFHSARHGYDDIDRPEDDAS